MALQSLKFTALSGTLWDHAQPWWNGWRAAGLNQWFLSFFETGPSYAIRRVERDGWVDFFLGNAIEADTKVHSILEGQLRIGLHFSIQDVDLLFGHNCPSTEIPVHLWDLLQQEIQFCRS